MTVPNVTDVYPYDGSYVIPAELFNQLERILRENLDELAAAGFEELTEVYQALLHEARTFRAAMR